MLKQLFKRFRHTGELSRDIDHPHLQQMAEQLDGGSYLDLLLDEVRPRVRARLELYPQSDPVLEIAAAALMAMFPTRFEALEGPLSDGSTPRHTPPPPAGDDPSAHSRRRAACAPGSRGRFDRERRRVRGL
ncbi:hypothetical protein EA187_00065 [Lujinxingia sediminis]|uniref:Uncharacterized protein n=1 Tax=Lujinxingia sediminis TaxID=2480984 RepID=A0ABY0CVM1_9DELT|nr:hypothetical protein [Lujinxingia sediminis]RVU47866.1 hypothetical protein EA187_00065 [Lujinxingia sediminis]